MKEPTSTREGAMGGGAGVGIRPDITGMWARFSCSPIHTRNEKNDRNNKNEGSTVITETAGLMMAFCTPSVLHASIYYPMKSPPPQQTLTGMTGTTGMTSTVTVGEHSRVGTQFDLHAFVTRAICYIDSMETW